MNELKEKLKDEIDVAYDYFVDEKHFDEVDDAVGFSEDAMRMYDVGYIRALEMVVRNLEELTVKDYE
jgi:hypothetical protein